MVGWILHWSMAWILGTSPVPRRSHEQLCPVDLPVCHPGNKWSRSVWEEYIYSEEQLQPKKCPGQMCLSQLIYSAWKSWIKSAPLLWLVLGLAGAGWTRALLGQGSYLLPGRSSAKSWSSATIPVCAFDFHKIPASGAQWLGSFQGCRGCFCHLRICREKDSMRPQRVK